VAAQHGEILFDQRMVLAVAIGLEVLAVGGEIRLGPHQAVEHPEHPAATVVDDAVVARERAVHLHERPLGFALPRVAVAVLDLLAEGRYSLR